MDEPEVILYIVHSPPSRLEGVGYWGCAAPAGIDKVEIHEKKIVHAMRFSLGNNVRVVIELASKMQDAQLDELLEKYHIDPSKIKKIDWILLDTSEKMRVELQKISTNPRRIIVMGYYLELCCVNSMRLLREAFPSTKINILKGDYTISDRNHWPYRPENSEGNTNWFKHMMRESRVVRTKLSRKLLH
jgi:hypothetical protein